MLPIAFPYNWLLPCRTFLILKTDTRVWIVRQFFNVNVKSNLSFLSYQNRHQLLKISNIPLPLWFHKWHFDGQQQCVQQHYNIHNTTFHYPNNMKWHPPARGLGNFDVHYLMLVCDDKQVVSNWSLVANTIHNFT